MKHSERYDLDLKRKGFQVILNELSLVKYIDRNGFMCLIARRTLDNETYKLIQYEIDKVFYEAGYTQKTNSWVCIVEKESGMNFSALCHYVNNCGISSLQEYFNMSRRRWLVGSILKIDNIKKELDFSFAYSIYYFYRRVRSMFI
jgi:hypothetical protein